VKCNSPAIGGKRYCRDHQLRAKRAAHDRRKRLALERELNELTLTVARRQPLLADRRAAALYVRTSRIDQHPENQLPDIRRLAEQRGLEVVDIFEEKLSATRNRPAFEKMRRHAQRGAFNTLIVWALDRLGRSMFDVVYTVQELDRCGCRLLSVKEPWLDAAGPMRQLFTALHAWTAQQERERLIERTRAGITRARAEGVALGRPRIEVDASQLARLAAEGLSVRQIAAALGCSKTTAARRLSALQKSE
jgi:DNA invertase Pin-like site-specific DNA recombinase